MHFTEVLIILWPVFVSGLAIVFHRKQNSKKGWTGGPISWPKSFWLSYTVLVWFFLPLVFLFHPEFPKILIWPLVFHLLSWWVRGPLELVMIYRWFNWTPVYGISHDLFHVLGVTIISYYSGIFSLNESSGEFGILASVFVGIILFSTLAEMLFAFLFLNARTRVEVEENIYFASDDPKWKRINRITLTVVVIVMFHLILQSAELVAKQL